MVSTRALHTPLCDLLGIRYPIIQAPMAGWTTPELVASVSNAGGFGMLAAGRLSTDQIISALEEARERTEGPFGINFLIAPPGDGSQDVAGVQTFLDRFRQELHLPVGSTDLAVAQDQVSEQLDVALEFGVPVVSFALGDPGGMVKRVHQAGAKAIVTVTTVAEARIAADRGADVIVAQGYEAGGHRSKFQIDDRSESDEVGVLALIPQVVDEVPVPVVASGGIMDGRGVVAALALGAQGVQMGTRFLGALESGATPGYRERLRSAAATDTVVSRAFSGRPGRVVNNRFSTDFAREGQQPLGWPSQNAAASDIFAAARSADNTDYFPVFAGQGVGMMRDGQRADKIIEELIEEAGAVLARLTL